MKQENLDRFAQDFPVNKLLQVLHVTTLPRYSVIREYIATATVNDECQLL